MGLAADVGAQHGDGGLDEAHGDADDGAWTTQRRRCPAKTSVDTQRNPGAPAIAINLICGENRDQLKP